jgi:hypothetical protein
LRHVERLKIAMAASGAVSVPHARRAVDSNGDSNHASHPAHRLAVTIGPGAVQTELARRAAMTQPALSRLEADGVIPTIPCSSASPLPWTPTSSSRSRRTPPDSDTAAVIPATAAKAVRVIL